MSPAKFIPVGQVVLNVLVLGHSLSVGRIIVSPERERVHVEVLAIETDVLLAEHAIHMIGQPVPDLDSTQVQERSSQQPIGMILGQPRALGDALGLEPDERFHANGSSMVADGAKSTREALQVGAPRCLFWATDRHRNTIRRPSTSR